LQSSSVHCMKKVNVPSSLRNEFASVIAWVIPYSHTSRVDVITIDTSQRVPDDVILLCERWLV
jgi:hypothetical protein